MQHSSDDFSRAGGNCSLHEVKVLECDIALHSAPWQALAAPRHPTVGTHTEQLQMEWKIPLVEPWNKNSHSTFALAARDIFLNWDN